MLTKQKIGEIKEEQNNTDIIVKSLELKRESIKHNLIKGGK